MSTHEQPQEWSAARTDFRDIAPQPQKWTPEWVIQQITLGTDEQIGKRVADAHNAALAAVLEALKMEEESHDIALDAERDRNFAAEKELRDKAIARIVELKRELEAEQQKRADWNVVIEDLERQLAAELEKTRQAERKAEDLSVSGMAACGSLMKELDAEREKLKRIEDLVDGYNDDVRPAAAVLSDIDTVLAK